MKIPWHPLALIPVYKDALWGGSRLATVYGRREAPPRCAESWECSTRPDGLSVVRSGPLSGRTLADLARMDRVGLLGPNAPAEPDFPLLVKIIDATKSLSVQVHPDPARATAMGGEPKTEAWYILAAEPGASLIHGFIPGTTRERFERTLNHHPETLPQLLRRQMVTPGDVVFVPAGTVHAIGAGVLLLEIQQNSNTTYRLYDWGRVDHQGRPRDLHVDPALAVIDWSGAGGQAAAATPTADSLPEPGRFRQRVHSRWFVVDDARLTESIELDTSNLSFHGLFAVDGGLTVENENGQVTVAAGSTVLVPAAARRYTVTPSRPADSVLIVRFGIPPR